MIAALLLLADVGAPLPPPDPSRWAVLEVRDAGDVFAAAVSRGRAEAFAGRRDGRVVGWPIRRGAPARAFDAHAGYCYAVAPSPDAETLATAGLDGEIRLWSLETRTLRRTLRGDGEPVTALAWAGDGRLLSGGPSGARIWSHEGRAIDLAGHDLGVAAVAARGDLGATADPGGAVRIWSAVDGRLLRAFEGHAGGAFAASFSPSGRAVVSGGADGALREWPLDGGPGRTFEGDAGVVRALAFSPDGRLLLSAGPAGAVVWDVRRGAALRSLDPGGAGAVGAAFGASGREALVTAQDGRVWTWGEGEARAGGPSVRAAGFLGVSYVDAGGAFVQRIFPGSQAERAGFQPGDLITGVDGLRIGRSDEFLEFMRRAREGDDLHVRIRRAGAARFIRVKLGRWEDR